MAVHRTPREVADWAAEVQRDLAKLLARRETSAHRVLTLSESFDKLTVLSIKQDRLMRDALRCAEQGLYGPAHVSGWAALVDFCHEWVTDSARLPALQLARPKWSIERASDLRKFVDFQLFEAMEAAGFISKTTMKAMHGLLNKRNECAHPEDYDPSINDTLGYLDELLKRIGALQQRS